MDDSKSNSSASKIDSNDEDVIIIQYETEITNSIYQPINKKLMQFYNHNHDDTDNKGQRLLTDFLEML